MAIPMDSSSSVLSPGLRRPPRDFLLVLVLFVAFRVMTLLAFRPGGQVLDYSDFHYFREFSQLTRQGYYPYLNLWSPYPPLFPFLMIGAWWISTLLPPWEFPNLWFTLLLGGVFLAFEAGNLVLIYAIAGRLSDGRTALRSACFYALLFVPVYTMTGWFDSFPLFFFLLGLYLLLCGHLLWSAVVSGIGFMAKLIPVILLPIGARLSRDEAKILTIPWLNLTFDVRHVALYLGTFVLTVALMQLPFYLLNPRLATASLAINSAREPWETVWALLEGKYGYGIVPLDVRNVAWQPIGTSNSLPWLPITLVFAAIFLVVYTRPFDWRAPRNVLAFTGFTLILFMLYSKGYSPQWLGWVLAFIALLLPNLRGAFYAVVVSLANLIEGNVFFTMVPDEHWLLMVTVGLRTLIFILVGAECLFILRPHWLTPVVGRAWRWMLIGLAAVLVIGAMPASVRFVQAYFDVRHQLSPYRATIDMLRTESQPGAALILTSYDHRAYDWLYPYLRGRLAFYMLDDYAPPGESVKARTLATLEQIAQLHRDWWFFDSNPSTESPSERVADSWLEAHAAPISAHDIDKGRLYHFNLPLAKTGNYGNP
jgi:hypothetical protein